MSEYTSRNPPSLSPPHHVLPNPSTLSPALTDPTLSGLPGVSGTFSLELIFFHLLQWLAMLWWAHCLILGTQPFPTTKRSANVYYSGCIKFAALTLYYFKIYGAWSYAAAFGAAFFWCSIVWCSVVWCSMRNLGQKLKETVGGHLPPPPCLDLTHQSSPISLFLC